MFGDIVPACESYVNAVERVLTHYNSVRDFELIAVILDQYHGQVVQPSGFLSFSRVCMALMSPDIEQFGHAKPAYGRCFLFIPLGSDHALTRRAQREYPPVLRQPGISAVVVVEYHIALIIALFQQFKSAVSS